MGTHDCGCQTHWDDDLNHPVYDKACNLHCRQIPDGWRATDRAKVPVAASS